MYLTERLFYLQTKPPVIFIMKRQKVILPEMRYGLSII